MLKTLLTSFVLLGGALAQDCFNVEGLNTEAQLLPVISDLVNEAYLISYTVLTGGFSHFRYTAALAEMGMGCLAVYSDEVYEPWTEAAPILRVPSDAANARSTVARGLCYLHGFQYFMDRNNAKDVAQRTRDILESYGIDVGMIHSSIANCDRRFHFDDDSRKTCYSQVAEGNNYCPNVMASIVYAELDYHLRVDGWNAFGEFSAADSSGNPIVCERNCDRLKFFDYTGFEDSYRDEPFDDTRWEGQLSNDGLGSEFRQRWVVPQVGTDGVPLSVTRDEIDTLVARISAGISAFDLAEEAQRVIDEMNFLTEERKLQAEFSENKVLVAQAVGSSLFSALNPSLEERIFILYWLNAASYDAIMIAWNAKRIHNTLRPSTYINRMGGTRITSWGGIFSEELNVEQPARDWQAYLGIPAHSEFPSGSACICVMFAQATNQYLLDFRGIDPDDFPINSLLIEAGSSHREPGYTPRLDTILYFDNPNDVSETCRQSRHFSGTHFEPSTAAGRDMCDGVGNDVVTGHARRLLNGFTF